MSFLRTHARLLAVAVSCLALGAGASVIASAGAATTNSRSGATPAGKAAKAHPRARRAALRLARGAVHVEAVVHTKSGFRTVTLDRGYVESVSGDTLTLREATRNATYRTVTITVPSTARVRNQRRPATLSQLSAGEHVVVVQGLKRTWVIARAAVR
jgi:hypothetical protein